MSIWIARDHWAAICFLSGVKAWMFNAGTAASPKQVKFSRGSFLEALVARSPKTCKVCPPSLGSLHPPTAGHWKLSTAPRCGIQRLPLDLVGFCGGWRVSL